MLNAESFLQKICTIDFKTLVYAFHIFNLCTHPHYRERIWKLTCRLLKKHSISYGDYLVSFDLKGGKIVDCNDAFVEISGFDKKEQLGSSQYCASPRHATAGIWANVAAIKKRLPLAWFGQKPLKKWWPLLGWGGSAGEKRRWSHRLSICPLCSKIVWCRSGRGVVCQVESRSKTTALGQCAWSCCHSAADKTVVCHCAIKVSLIAGTGIGMWGFNTATKP